MLTLRLPGPPALSSFRHAKLLQQLRVFVPELQQVDARFEHFVALESELDGSGSEKLSELLRYGPAYSSYETSGQSLLVVPRL